MNPEWIDFLESISTVNSQHTDNTLTAISDLAILEVSGKDASQFLQGQLTCNINDVTESNSFFSAFCNAKGRTISTFLIVKNNANFLLILPVNLIEKVISKFTLYILRADVHLNTVLDKYCLIGLNSSIPINSTEYPDKVFEVINDSDITIKLPANLPRYLIITTINRGKQLFNQLIQTVNFSIMASDQWKYLDISAGLAWLDQDSSEEYIPQMLNIDDLGGISFQKGCYTGQEIVARTHYLGKAKRKLFLAECDTTSIINKNTAIVNKNIQTNTGKIISLQKNDTNCRLLLVIPTTESELKNLVLDNSNQDKLNIIDFQ